MLGGDEAGVQDGARAGVLGGAGGEVLRPPRVQDGRGGAVRHHLPDHLSGGGIRRRKEGQKISKLHYLFFSFFLSCTYD